MTLPLHILRDSGFAMHAASERPAWLFAADGSRLVLANAAGAVMLGHAYAQAAVGAAIAPDLAHQVARIAAALRADSPPQLHRLRGLGTVLGAPLTCTCSRITLASGSGVLIAAAEKAGPAMPLAERARRLIDGPAPLAAFDAGGQLLYATAKVTQRAGKIASLHDLGANVETVHIGSGRDALVVALFPADSESITSIDGNAALAAPPVSVDLSPIAEAITAMTKAPTPQNRPARRKAPRMDGADVNGSGRPTVRFFWETDAENRFIITSEDFIALAGARTANLLGRFWGEISAKLALDPEGLVSHALVSRDTWSGIDVNWPTADGSVVKVTLSGIPAFDRDGTFRGYRGLGIWHGAARVDAVPPDAPVRSGEPPATAEPPSGPTNTEAPVSSQPENVVPFRAANAEMKPPALNPAERTAFRDLGSRLAARLKGADELARGLMEKADPDEEPLPPHVLPIPAAAATQAAQPQASAQALTELLPDEDALAVQRPVLDRLPLGVLIYRGLTFIYANPAFLAFAGRASLSDFVEAGGLDAMFVAFEGPAEAEGGQRLRVAASGNDQAIAGQLVTVPFDGENAMVLMLQPIAATPAPAEQAPADHTGAAELAALLDVAADGVIVVDRDGTIITANARAEKLFGCDSDALTGRPFGDLFAPESERVATARLDRLARNDEVRDDDDREMIGRRRKGDLVSLQLTLCRTGPDGARRYALFRDITRWKDAEKEMLAARQQAEKASSAKSEFLAKISHEMRTPLNAIIGFSDVMMEERFGPVGNERYRDYLKDINTSGAHVVSLLNDLLDLSKIEAGKLELSFERVDLNEITQQSVAMMQPQASRARVIVRTALSMNIPGIIADARSVRQIVLNLLSNSIKFTSAGGQVIVSTAAGDRGDVILRVRDTGVGMSEKDIETALQPFRQLTTSPRTDINGTGLGLPLTKALTEANRARFTIKSAVNAGTLVEIAFPASRVLSE